ncbi:germination protein [Brevibacillus reuszeri]|uniref:Germination protein n=1 Tax=Brevibacillus reuszeri TaxID=54915 RepID=A0A0K9YYB2_9BACL|nr:endospore germination permease [Brevibacillus reuszeri]KNB73684.1 spore gernimation protein [Brevibacillus reuszeri]MED1858506.1 endospore germination permease [Brevibacillus reuszeri]GED69481.1 germination protein [Brevibacillus reuszeri]
MENQQRNISTWQLSSILISSMIGVGILTIPRTSTTDLHQMGWLGTITGALIAAIAIVAIVYLGKQFPGTTYIDYIPKVFGHHVGSVLSYPIILLFITFQFFNAGMAARGFGEVVITSVLQDTPLEAILITLFVMVLFLCCHEVEVVARVNELLIPFILIPVFLIPLASFMNAEWYNLMPIHIDSWKQAGKTTFNTFSVYTGYELLMFYFAFAMPGAKLGVASWTGLIYTFVAYFLTVIAGITVFGYEELQRLIWPTLELVKTTQQTGWFLERLESAFLAIWVASVFTTIGNMYYAMIFSLRLWFRKGIRFQRICALVITIPLYYFTLMPQNIVEMFTYMKKLTVYGCLPTIFIPVLLAVTQWIRVKLGSRHEKSKKGGT